MALPRTSSARRITVRHEASDKLGTLTIDNALTPGTDIGAVVDERQLAGNLKCVDIAKQEGGTVRGGEVLRRDRRLLPATRALDRHYAAMTTNREEVFSPVASVISLRDHAEALSVANDTEFGLWAGICTSSLKHAAHFKLQAQTGMVMVNLPTAGVDYQVPLSGRKGSSYAARGQGTCAREFYTTVKTACVFSG